MADLNKQLGIQQQINKLLADRAKMIDTATSSLSAQTQVAVELCKALDCEDLAGIQDRLQGISEGLGTAARSAEDFGQASEDATDKAAEGGEKSSGIFGKMAEHLTATKGAAVGAGVGIVSGMKGAQAQAQAAAEGIKAVSASLFGVGKSILMLPFKIMGGLAEMAGAGGGGGPNPIKVALEDIRGEFGSLASNEGKALADGLDNLKGSMGDLGGTGVSLAKVFGRGKAGMAAALKELHGTASAMGPVFGLLKDEFAANAGELLAFKKGLGIADDAMKALGQRAIQSGKSLTDVLHEQANLAIQMGEAHGISAKLVSKSMNEMTKDVANFGQLSQKELAATAVFAAKLGLEAKDLLGVIDKFDNFEDAAEGASMLAQSFGMNVDAMEMMNAQNPAERIDILRKSFQETGKSVEDMSRQELKLLASQMGLSEEAAKSALSQENLGTSYDDLLADADAAEEAPLSQAEAMSKLADSMQKVFGSGGGKQMSGFFDAFAKGFSKGIMRSKEMRKLMRNMRKSMKVVYKAGKELGKMFVNLFPGIKDMLGGLAELFDPKRIKKMMGKVLGAFKDFFKAIKTDPKAGVETLLKRLKNIFGQFFDSKSGAGAKVVEGFKKFIKAFGGIVAGLIPVAVKALTGMINKLAESINNPKSTGIAQNSVFQTIMTALMNAFDALMAALPGLIKALLNLFIAAFKSPKIRKVILIIGGAMLAKALLTMALSAVKGAIVGKIGGIFAKFFGKSMDKAGGKVGGTGGAKSMNKSIGEKSGMGKSLKTFFQAMGEIKPMDVIKAGIIMMLLVVMMAGSLLLFAITIKQVAKILAPVPFKDLVKSFIGLAMALGSVAVMIQIGSMLNPGQMLMAMVGLALGAVMLIVGGYAFAEALVEVVSAMSGVDGAAAAKAMLALGLAAMATLALAMAGTALVVFGAAGIAGVYIAGMFLEAAAGGFIEYTAMVTAQMAGFSVMDAVKQFLGLALIAMSIALIAVPMALAGMVAVPAAIGAVLIAGLLLALNFVMLPLMKMISKKWAGKIDWMTMASDFIQMAVVFAALAVASIPLALMSIWAIPATIGLLMTLGFFMLFPFMASYIKSTGDAMSQIDWVTLAAQMIVMAITFGALALAAMALAASSPFMIPAAIGLVLQIPFWIAFAVVLPLIAASAGLGSSVDWVTVAVMMASFALVQGVLLVTSALAIAAGAMSLLGAIGLALQLPFWLAFIILLPLLAIAYTLGSMMDWIGMSTMMVEFAVVQLSLMISGAIAFPAGLLAYFGSIGLEMQQPFWLAFIALLPYMAIAYALGASVDWMGMSLMMIQFSIILASVGIAGTLALVAGVIAGLASFFLPGIGLFMIGLQSIIPAISQIAGSGVDWGAVAAMSGALIVFFIAMGVMALASLALGIFANPFIMWVALVGFLVIKTFANAITTTLAPAIQSLANIKIADPGSFAQVMSALGQMFTSMKEIGEVGIALAEIDADSVEEGAEAGGTIDAVTNFVTMLMQGVGGMITTLVGLAQGLNEGDLEKVMGIGDLLAKIGPLVAALQPPPGMFDAIAEAADEVDDSSEMKGVLEEMSKMMTQMMEGLGKTIPAIIQAVLDVKIDNPEAARPKLELIAMAMEIVGSFGKTISDITKLAGELGAESSFWGDADPAEGMDQMKDIMEKTKEGMTANLPGIVAAVIAAGDLFGDAEKARPKIELVGLAMEIVATFAEVISTMVKTMKGIGIDPSAEGGMGKLLKTMKSIVTMIAGPDGLGTIIAGVVKAADKVGASAGAETKLKLLALAMKVVADFSGVIADVVKLAPGKKDATIEKKMENLKFVLDKVVGFLLGGLSTVIDAVVKEAGKMKGGAEMTTKLENLASAMETVSKFAKVLGDVAKLVPKDPKAAGTAVDSIGKIVEDIVGAITGSPGFGDLIGAILTVLDDPAFSDKGMGKKLGLLADVMDVVGKFAETLVKVSSVAPKPSLVEGAAGTAPSLMATVGSIVGAVTKHLPLLVGAITKTEVPTDRKFTKKLKNLGLVMDAVGKFGDVISKLGGMKAEGGIAAQIGTIIGAIITITKGEGNTLPSLLKAIGDEKWTAAALKPNTKILTKLNDFMTKYGESLEGVKSLGGTAIEMGTVFTDINKDIVTMSNALGTLPAVDVKAKLTAFGQELWKGDGGINIEHGPIQLTVNIKLEVDAKKMATALEGSFATASG